MLARDHENAGRENDASVKWSLDQLSLAMHQERQIGLKGGAGCIHPKNSRA